MDFYKNIDHLGCENAQQNHSVSGVEYQFLTDLTEEPVSLEDFKEHCRIDYNTDDALLAKYLKAARQYLEQWSQLSFGVRTVQMTALSMVDNWKVMFGPVDTVKLPYKKFGKDIITNSRGNNVTIEYTTKWPLGLPEDIKVAICLEAATMYMVRESVVFTVNGVAQSPDETHDRALKLVNNYSNITFL